MSKFKKYKIIYADPPWRFKVWCRDTGLGRSADSHYKTMTLDNIKKLPVPAADNCALFLWVTLPMLQEGLDVIKAWGFTYKTVAFTWVKRNKIAKTWFWGMGYWTRANAELCLIATKGKVKRRRADVHQVIESPIRQHSQKQTIVREKIVQLMGDIPRIELFARERVNGWDAWGNEVKSDIKMEDK